MCATCIPFRMNLIALILRSCALCNSVHPPKKFLLLSESIFPSTSSQTRLFRVISPLHIGGRYQASLSYKTTRKICRLYVLIFRVLQDMSQVVRVRLPLMDLVKFIAIIQEGIAHRETTDITKYRTQPIRLIHG